MRLRTRVIRRAVAAAWAAMVVIAIARPAGSSAQELPAHLHDRGTGIPTSIFGTYVGAGELLVYPFYEFYHDSNFEYEPADFGLGSKREYRGRYTAHEGVLFVGYGISDRFAVEVEAGVISAELIKAEDDTSAVPERITESGVSDVEAQLRWRWNRETASRPELFSYFEVVFPTGETHSLIGTADWEFALGGGLIKGFAWGTITFRLSGEYDAAENTFGFGEYALEYLKKVSNRIRLFAMLEGTEDEVALVPEVQWYLSDGVLLKANVGIGITSKATDIAPEVGVMFRFR